MKKDKFSMVVGVKCYGIEASKRLLEALASVMTEEEKAQFAKIVEKELKRVSRSRSTKRKGQHG